MALLRLELCAVKVARTVLRRGSSSNAVPLSDALGFGIVILLWAYRNEGIGIAGAKLFGYIV